MQKSSKRICLCALLILMGVSITTRIASLNMNFDDLYTNISECTDDIDYSGIKISTTEYKIYKGEELNKLYDNQLDDMVDNYDLLFNITLENMTGEIKQYNAASSGIMYGYNSGGNTNPYLYQYFNQNTSGIVELNPGEVKTITLAFHYEECNSNIVYIVSLYPENIQIKLR